jgi:hypothetical protein
MWTGGYPQRVVRKPLQDRFYIPRLEHQFTSARLLCGRAYAYGLAAAGEVGMARALEILRADVERTLKRLGGPSVAVLGRSYLEVAARFWPAHS